MIVAVWGEAELEMHINNRPGACFAGVILSRVDICFSSRVYGRVRIA